MIVYRCEDTLESIFTAVYLAYEEKRDLQDTYLSLTEDPMLFAMDVPVTADEEKAGKVARTLVRRFGERDYHTICLALATEDTQKAQAVFRTIVQGLARTGTGRGMQESRMQPGNSHQGSSKGHLFDNLADDSVHKAFALARYANREVGHLIEFVRFEELENGILYSRVGPKVNALAFMMPHFADRLPIENFVIFDDRRNLFGIHPAGKAWYLFHGEEIDQPQPVWSGEEGRYQELFRHFVKTIAIKERYNLKLQRNMLPLRFQEYMTEFQ